MTRQPSSSTSSIGGSGTLRQRNITNDTTTKINDPTSTTTSQVDTTLPPIQVISTRVVSVYGYPIPFWLISTVVRVMTAVGTRTYFCPDEYWQSWEVAHRAVYGYGYLTWEWQEQVRSFSYPALTAGMFHILKLLNWDSYFLLMNVPKLLNSSFAILCDVYTVRLGARLFGPEVVGWTMFCTLTSWFHSFVSTRSIPNVPEMTLTVVALYYWPWPHLTTAAPRRGFELALSLAALSCLLRPTAAVPWLYLGLRLIFSPTRKLSLLRIGLSTTVILVMALLLQLTIDHQFFKSWVLVPWRFYQFNVAQSISSFYGVSDGYFYFLLGIPTLLTTFLPLLAYGSTRSKSELLGLVGVVTGVYSLLPHKELRLILTVLPLLLIVVAFGLSVRLTRPFPRYLLPLLVLTQLPVALYLNRWHQSGVVEVLPWLRDRPDLNSVGFLMPCHSTPFHAQLHRPVPMWFITCHPPINLPPITPVASYLDTSDHFYADPPSFLLSHLHPNASVTSLTPYLAPASPLPDYHYFWPSHLVLFRSLLDRHPTLLPLLLDQHYHLCHSLFNSHFHDDPRRRGPVLVYCQSKV